MRASLWSASSTGTGTGQDASDPNTWDLGDQVFEGAFQTDGQGQATIPVALGAGIYRAMLATQDRFGKPVAARLTFQVVDPKAKTYGIRLANHFAAPGGPWSRAGPSSACGARAMTRAGPLWRWSVEARSWRPDGPHPSRTQEVFERPVTEKMRGGFTVRVTYVRENRAYVNERIVDVPWTNKQLSVRWEHFTSLLEPGQKESWTAIITGPDANKAVAEMVAGMYDASLDQYLAHQWMQRFSVFRQEYGQVTTRFENQAVAFSYILGSLARGLQDRGALLSQIPGRYHGYGLCVGQGAGREARPPRTTRQRRRRAIRPIPRHRPRRRVRTSARSLYARTSTRPPSSSRT